MKFRTDWDAKNPKDVEEIFKFCEEVVSIPQEQFIREGMEFCRNREMDKSHKRKKEIIGRMEKIIKKHTDNGSPPEKEEDIQGFRNMVENLMNDIDEELAEYKYKE